MKKLSALIVLAGMSAFVVAAPVSSRSAPPAIERSADDPAPNPESGAPDPLAPKQSDKPAPLAPGALDNLARAAPAGDSNPVVVLVRHQLSSAPARQTPSGREDYDAVVNFYAAAQPPVWTGKDGFTLKAKQAMDEIAKADEWGLKASAFEIPALTGALPEDLAKAEVQLSLAVLKYARHARGGRLNPSTVSRKFDQKPTVYEPKSVLQAIAGTNDADAYLRGLHPKHPQFERLRQALLPARKMEAGGERPAGSKTGASVQQIIVNMERWRWMPAELGAFHVWDSIPEQMTRVIENGKEVLAEKIVVGRVSSPTPIFSADMLFVIFHPSWGMPPGMKSAELAPRLRDSGGGWFSSKPLASEVLKAHGLQVTRNGVAVDPDAIDWKAADIGNFEFEQAAGPTNVLGIVKFRFPNSHDVYMHDTPERNLFNGRVRAFSHGCMRVQNPLHLAEVLLTHDKGWPADKIKEYERHGNEVTLTTPIPVHVTYFTVTVDDAGTVSTWSDLYGLDSRVASALEGREIAVTSTAAVPSEPVAKPGSRTVQAPRMKPKTRQKTAAAPLQPFNPFSLFQN